MISCRMILVGLVSVSAAALARPCASRSGLGCFRRRFVFVAEFLPKGGPKLFHHDGQRVVSYFAAPYAERVRKIPLVVGVVTVSRNSRTHGGSEDLREIELPAARVGARDEDSADRISGAMPKRPLA